MTPTYSDVDLFAGPGGWDEGFALLGRRNVLGIEWDANACATAEAAGHARMQADIAALHPLDVAGPSVEGLIASPPCQGFSAAGKGRGRQDSAAILAGAGELAAGRDPRADLAGTVKDPRSVLALEPLRWALELEPEWMCWEQVPAVLPLWQACAEILRADGYSAWAGYVTAEQYGVPQTRKRAILVASRNHDVGTGPIPTHRKYRKGVTQHEGDPALLPWVSMAEALGWGMTARPYPTIAAGTASGGADAMMLGGSGARKIVHDEQAAGRWQYVNGNQANSARRNLDEPAPTVHFGARMNLVTWQLVNGPQANAARRDLDEPAGTIYCPRPGNLTWQPRPVDAPAGTTSGDAATTVRVTVDEAAVLQSFAPGYPWQGTKTAQYQQVGNAVPPLLAAHIGAHVLGLDLRGIDLRAEAAA